MRADVAATYLNLAKLKEQLGLNTEARTAFEEALARYQALAEANPGDPDLRARIARAHSDLGQMHAAANAFADALPAMSLARLMQRSEPAFQPLRSRREFQKLLDDLTAKTYTK